MINKFVITIAVIQLVFFYGTYTAYAQGFSSIIEKLEKIEARLDQQVTVLTRRISSPRWKGFPGKT